MFSKDFEITKSANSVIKTTNTDSNKVDAMLKWITGKKVADSAAIKIEAGMNNEYIQITRKLSSSKNHRKQQQHTKFRH